MSLARHGTVPCLLIVLSGLLSAQPAPPTAPQSVLGPFHALAGTLQPIVIPALPPPGLSFPIWLDGGWRTVQLQRRSVRAPFFQLLAHDVTGLIPVLPPPAGTYRGTVVGFPGSKVALGILGTGLSGVIRLSPGRALMGISPVRLVDPNAPSDLHLVHDARHNAPHPGTCGFTSAPGMSSQIPGSFGARSGVNDVAELAVDCDYHFYLDNGSSMSQTIQDAETIINACNVIYENDVDISHLVTTMIVRTSAAANPYSTNSASGLLNQFSNQWNSTHASVQRDVAHLMTGRNLSGSTIGIAQLGVICSLSNGYSLSERYTNNQTSRTGLLAHELGHNWGAGHCSGGSCWIMCSSINGCGSNLTAFSQSSINTILAYKATLGCLTSGPPPTPETSTVRNSRRLNPTGSNPGSASNGPALAVRGHRVVCAWAEQQGGSSAVQDIFAAVSEDEGNTFAPMVRVDVGDAPHSADSERPQVAICDDGTIICAWEDTRAASGTTGSHDALVGRSTNGGQSFSAPQALNATTAGTHITSDVSDVQLAVVGNTVYACWLEDALSGLGQAQELRFARSLNSGLTWSAPAVLNPQIPGHSNGSWPHNDASEPRIAVNGSTVIIAYVDDRNQLGGQNQDDVFVLVSTNQGATFTDRALETSTSGDAGSPAVAVDGQRVAVLFLDESSGQPAVHSIASSNLFATWSSESVLSSSASTPGAAATAPDVAMSGTVALATWADDAGNITSGGQSGYSGRRAMVRRSSNGGQTWSSSTPVDSVGGRPSNAPRVTIQYPFAYLAMELGMQGQNQIGFVRSADLGASFGDTEELTTTDANMPAPGIPAFASDPIHRTGIIAFRDLTSGGHEPHAAAIRSPRLILSAPPTLGTSVQFQVDGVPLGANALLLTVVMSATGTAPSYSTGATTPMLHLVPDALTIALLTEPSYFINLNGSFSFFGIGSAGAFPWPLPAGAPDLYAAAIVHHAGTGIIEYVSEPLALISQ